MGLFTLLARCLVSPRKKQSLAERLTAAPLAPKRLERRRVLDASAVGAVLGPLGDSSEFVQVGETLESLPPQTAAVVGNGVVGNGVEENTPPDNVQILSLDDVFENGVAELRFTFDDPDFEDTHTVEIDWGDSTPTETINLAAGERFVQTTHQYLDDNPTGTPMDVNQVQITVTDSYGSQVSGSAPINVINVAPKIDSISVTSPVNENDIAELQLSFTDPGSLDTHTVEIDWGDGTPTETINLTGGERSLQTTHQYLDDNPTGTPSDVNQVQVTITDDDTGVGTAMASVTVNNLLPTVTLDPVTMIDENGAATLSGKINDVGTLDTFKLDLLWGDVQSPNNSQTFMLGTTALTEAADGINWNPTTGEFSLSHTYLDDNPTFTASDLYTISVTVTDDDTGVGTASELVLVKNVAPIVTIEGEPTTSPEGTQINLTSTVTDLGTLDTFAYAWDVTVGGNLVASGSSPTFSFTPADDGLYMVTLTVADDDLGIGSDTVEITVENVPPTVILNPVAMIDENGSATLSGQITDPGTEDTFELEINWGDALSPDNTQTFMLGNVALTEAADGVNWNPTTREFSLSHQYLDDNPTVTSSDTYTIGVKATDDDTGEGLGEASVLVKNVSPTVTLDPVAMINENEFAVLSGEISDVGTLDTFTLDIDWGDPSSPPLMQSFSLGTTMLTEAVEGINWDPTTRVFSLSHQYLDDNPSMTPSDIYTIGVKVTDDDSAMAIAETTVTVKNVNLSLTLDPVDMIDENNSAVLTGTIVDVGSLDTFELMIDWGDPISPDNMQTFMLGTTALAEATDGIDWDPTTGLFSVRRQYLEDNPTATSSDTYTIDVSVAGDDLSEDAAMATVVVKNVAPTVTLDPVAMIEENGTASLSGSISDPGTLDTFTLEFDWDDPLSPNNMQSFSLDNAMVLTEAADGINWDPTTREFSLSHQYLDDNPSGSLSDTYTISAKATDDDTGEGLGEAMVLVKNVIPVVKLDPVATILESGVATLTGSFTDVGTLDTHTATVSWGDGTTSSATIVELNGSGTLSASHQYLDNDDDNIYPITVTVLDDDRGSGETTVPVTVYNVNPTFVDVDPTGPNVIVAADLDSRGETILIVQFFDPGKESEFVLTPGQSPFEIHVDWGEHPSMPGTHFIKEVELDDVPTGVIVIPHKYLEAPDPLHPTNDILISVKIRDDDFYTPIAVTELGESEVATVLISNPGLGAEPFRIDTTPQVPRLQFRREARSDLLLDASNGAEALLQGADLRAVSSDSQATTESLLELRVIDSYEVESEGIRLKSKVLNDLPKLFLILPDNHYAIYLIRIETATERLVIEVYVRNGKVIDPSDDSEGTRDRPPTDEVTRDQVQQILEKTEKRPDGSMNIEEIRRTLETELGPDNEILIEPVAPPDDQGARLPPGGLLPIATGLVATRSIGSWARQVDRAVAQAGPKKWRKLRQRSRKNQKNR